MKRIVAILSVTALLLCCAACSNTPADGGSTSTTTAANTTTTTAQEVGTTTTADTATGTTTTTKNGDVQGATLPPTTTTTTTAQVILDGDKETFKETTVVDTAHCRVTVLSVEEDEEIGYVLHTRLENLTTDKELLFAVETAAINGVLVDPLFVTQLAAGAREEADITFLDIVPENVDLGEYTDIMLVFSVSDVEDWEAPPLAETATHLYPLGADKANVYRHTSAAGQHLLVENEYVTVIAVNSAEDTTWGGYRSDIYFLNKTAEPLLFSIDEATINSYGIEPYFATYVLPGYSFFGEVQWLEDSLANSHIDKVEQLEFLLTVYRNMDWGSIEDEDEMKEAILVSEEVRFTP